MNQIRHSGANSATPGLREHQLGGTSLDLAATLTSSSPILPLTLARVTSQNRSIPGQGQCKERQSLPVLSFVPSISQIPPQECIWREVQGWEWGTVASLSLCVIPLRAG